jgi:putative flippase GtrA
MIRIIGNYFKKSHTFVRFIAVGMINTIIGISLILLLLNVFGASYWVSTFIGNSVGALISYFLNRNFTFNSNVSNKKGMGIFFVVILVSYFISYDIGYKMLTRNLMNLNLYGEELSILCAAFIYTILNYLGQRFLTFKSI